MERLGLLSKRSNLIATITCRGVHDDIRFKTRRGVGGGWSYLKPYLPRQRYNNTNYWRRFRGQQRLDIPETEALLPPKRFTEFEKEFNAVGEFQSQIDSLKTRGFQRPYKPYEPPPYIDSLVIDTVNKFINIPENSDLTQILLDDPAVKCSILKSLSEETAHLVPNSFLHTIKSVDNLLHFYRSPVQTTTPYDKLEAQQRSGKLPPNLHVQLDPVRFDPKGEGYINRITAYPGSRTIISEPEARKKYKDDPYERDPYRDNYKGLPEN